MTYFHHVFDWIFSIEVYIYRENPYEFEEEIEDNVKCYHSFNLPFWTWVFKRKYFKRLRKLTKLRAYYFAHMKEKQLEKRDIFYLKRLN